MDTKYIERFREKKYWVAFKDRVTSIEEAKKIEDDLIKLLSEVIEEVRRDTVEEYIKIIGNDEPETIIEDCENCGNEGYGRAWFGYGDATGDAWGDRYNPTGSVVFCEECKPDFKIGKEWDGERIWKVTSDLEAHKDLRINYIKKRDVGAIARNKFRNEILSKLQKGGNDE